MPAADSACRDSPTAKCLRCVRPAPDDARTRCRGFDRLRLEEESPNRPKKPCHGFFFESVFIQYPRLSLRSWVYILCNIMTSLSSLFQISLAPRWLLRCFLWDVILYARKKPQNTSFTTVLRLGVYEIGGQTLLLTDKNRTHPLLLYNPKLRMRWRNPIAQNQLRTHYTAIYCGCQVTYQKYLLYDVANVNTY